MRLPRKEGLNIVPFIDVMLVLLAIVLSAATFISQGHIKIKVPQSSQTSPNENIEKISILLDSESKFHIDEREVSIDELKARVQEIGANTLVELVGDKDARFQAFIEILDILKEKNHEKFVIKAEAKN